MKIRDNSGLTIDGELRSAVPAIFSHRASSKMSDGYQLYRSDLIIDQMLDSGMKLVEVDQLNSRRRDPATNLHTMRFQSLSSPSVFGVNDSVPEVLIVNSHNGIRKFAAYAGVFRFICSNGMVVADQDFGRIFKRHFGKNNSFEQIQELLKVMPETVNKVSKRILDWSALDLSLEHQVELATKLMASRGTPAWVEPTQVLEAVRVSEAPSKDGKRNLWTTFNVLQENLTSTKINHEGGRGALRELTGAHAVVKVNEGLWAAADAYYNVAVDGLSEDEAAQLEKARNASAARAYRFGKKKETELA